MSRRRDTPQQKARETSREARATAHGRHDRQDYSDRDFQHGTQRNETQIEGGQRRNDAGSLEPGNSDMGRKPSGKR